MKCPTKQDDYRVQTPFIKLFLRLYGNLSVQLYPITSKRSHLVSLLWNVSLISLFIYYSTTYHRRYITVQYNDTAMLIVFARKPLFGILIQIVMFIFPVSYFFITFYYLHLAWQGNQLVRLLDSFPIDCFVSPSKARQLFVLGTTLHLLVYTLTMLPLMHSMLQLTQSWTVLLMQFFVFLTLNINANITFILTSLYKFATLCSLRDLVAKLATIRTPETERQVEHQISRLAALNYQLNSLLSFPLVFVMLTYSTEIIIAFSTASVKSPDDAGNYLLQFCIQIFYLCHLERQIQLQLSILGALLSQPLTTSMAWFTSRHYLTLSADSLQQLRSTEFIAIHRHYFHLRVYNLYRIHWPLILALSLFSLNYIVLVSQTSSIN